MTASHALSHLSYSPAQNGNECYRSREREVKGESGLPAVSACGANRCEPA
jgi:hypothetical protein